MRSSHNNPLTDFLISNGIRPSSFAHFLSCYIKQKPSAKRTALSVLLTDQLREQAEIIAYHLKN
jgi:hypothetical protein